MSLRIFISGTQDDMAPERDAAAAVIQALGHEPIRAETSGSASAPPLNVCIEMARSCDLYIGIFGPRYGSIPEGMSISVSELEFDIARGADATRLVYRKEGPPEPKQAAFLAKVENFSDGYFRRPRFRDIDELKDYVRTDVAEWMAQRVRRSAVTLRGDQTPQEVPTRRRRSAKRDEIRTFLEALEAGLPKLRVQVLKDIEALCYRAEIEKVPEIITRMRALLRGSPEVRIQALKTLRLFLGMTDAAYRRDLAQQLHGQALQQFMSAQDIAVKQEAMNILGELIELDDLPHILYHVTDAPPDIYNVTRPFYIFNVLKRQGHEIALRQALYDLKQGALPEDREARVDDLLESLRTER